MKLLKSKQGFTLIELLVVIGILAVLAAIAIPSVAGLIDRANVSADATNANEMTNAVERFVSEYELYCQDLASNQVKLDNLDAAQGRVYNVTGVTDRAGIEALEKDATAGPDTTGKAIYRDTKYPVNAETMQSIVENYMKTSSSTFTPKQSDCHFYYSPDCGLVVCTETEASDVADLNKLVQSGKDAKGKDLGTSTKWIDLTANVFSNDTSANIDWSTIDKDNLEANTWESIQKVVSNGKISETNWKVGDTSPIFQCDGNDFTAKLIGIGQDGANTATFMIFDGIGNHVMNTNGSNAGGWKASEMYAWLNGNIYNSMSNNDCIKEVTKMTNNTGYQGTTATSTSDKVLLLSLKEIGMADDITGSNWYPEEYKQALETEGTTYTWFETNTFDGWFWLRSPDSSDNGAFFSYDGGDLNIDIADTENTVCPVFVIG